MKSVHPDDHLKYDKFTRMSIGAGSFEEDKYVYALYYISSFEEDTGSEDVLFSLRYCSMYPGEPKQEYAKNEYRRIYRQALPTNLEEGVVQAALDEYNQRKATIATATERFLAKPLK